MIEATPATVAKALADTKSGDTLRLMPGAYPLLALKRRRELTVMAVPGAILGAATVEGCQDLLLEDLVVEGALDPSGRRTVALAVRTSPNVTIRRADLSGSFNGLVHAASDHLSVTGCRLHHLAGDAVHGDSAYVLLAGNRFSDFCWDPAGTVHPDIAQFWSTGGRPVLGVEVVGNVFTKAAGRPMQGILISPGLVAPRVEGNLLDGALDNGILVSGATDPEVRDNLCIAYLGDEGPKGRQTLAKITLTGCTGGEAIDNHATRVKLPSCTGTVARGNVEIPLVEPGDHTLVAAWAAERLAGLSARMATPEPQSAIGSA